VDVAVEGGDARPGHGAVWITLAVMLLALPAHRDRRSCGHHEHQDQHTTNQD